MSNFLSKQYIIYSLIAMPLSVIGLPLYIYLPTFYSTEVGISIATVGTILFIARLTDVVTDPLIGLWSDFCVKYFGSRKPIMVLGSFILIVSFYYLLNPHSDYPIFWLMVFSILIYFGFSMINVPYLTFCSEISNSYYIKTKLNSFRETFTIFGLLLALIFPYLFSSNLITDKLNSLYTLFLALFIPFFLVTMWKLNVNSVVHSINFSFKKLKNIYQTSQSIKLLQLGYFFNNLANAIPATLFLLFIESVIKAQEFSSHILILYFFSGVIALPFWMMLSRKIGKKRVWVLSIILACLSFIFVIFLKEGSVVAFGVISFISGLSLGADIAFPTSIQADIVQKQNSFSGILFGIWTMITKLSLSFAIFISFGILGLVGFDKDNLTTLSTLTLTLLYGLLPIILKLIALIFISRFKEDEKTL